MNEPKIVLKGLALDESWPCGDKPAVSIEYDGNSLLLYIQDRRFKIVKTIEVIVDPNDQMQLLIRDADSKRVLFNINSFTGKPYKESKGIK